MAGESRFKNAQGYLEKGYPSREAANLAEDAAQSEADRSAMATVKDTGGWSYEDMGGGLIRVVTAPPGSKMAGQILDPKKIDAITDPTQRARAGKAYASIKSVMAGGKPIPQDMPAKMPAKMPSAPAPSAGGATDPGTPGMEGLPMTGVPSNGGVPSARSTILGEARPRTKGGM
jgi:hypothetical protein